MKKLAIIGASYLQLPLVLKAKEMGIETHCFAWAEGAVCKDTADFYYPVSIVEKEEILNICRQIKIDGITTIASDAAVPTVCFVAEKMNLVSNSFADSLVTTDKYRMRQTFLKNSIASPKFALVNESIDFNDFTLPLIVKPTDRSGSRGVFKVEKSSDLHNAIETAKAESFTKQAIIEEYVSGNEVSIETISWKGKHYILQITDKTTTGEPYFVELEHHQPSQLHAEIQNKIKNETQKALNALNIRYGASHTEMKITETGDIYLIEIGARMGGDFIGSNLVQLSTGYDFLAGVINISLGKFNEPVLKNKKFSGVYFLSKETGYLKQIIEQKSLYPEIVQAEITDNKLQYIKCSADRSGYFIYQADKKFLI